MGSESNGSFLKHIKMAELLKGGNILFAGSAYFVFVYN
jgi:hypothetical protein